MNKKSPRIGITVDNFKGLTPSQLLTITSKFGVRFVELTESVFDDLDNVKKTVGEMETGFHLPNLHDFGYDFSHRDKHEHIQKLIKKIRVTTRLRMYSSPLRPVPNWTLLMIPPIGKFFMMSEMY